MRISTAIPTSIYRGSLVGAAFGLIAGIGWACHDVVPGAIASAVAMVLMHLFTGGVSGALGAVFRRNRTAREAALFGLATGFFLGFVIGFPFAMGAVMLRPPTLSVHGDIALAGTACLATGSLAGALVAFVTKGPEGKVPPPPES